MATTTIGIVPMNTIFLNTSPSFPLNPAVLQPTITLAGAITLPIDAPAVWAASMNGTLNPSISAVLSWSWANKTLELLLLPVIKAPRNPMKGDNAGYR